MLFFKKATSLLTEKVFFSVIALNSLKSSLFDIYGTRLELKAWSPYKSEGSQAHACEHVYKAFHVCLGLHIVVMIAGIHTSQEIFAINILTALKPSLEHDGKHVVQLLRLYEYQP